MTLYSRLASVADLGLAELIFDAYDLALTPDDALALVDRLGAVHQHQLKMAADRARHDTDHDRESSSARRRPRHS